MVATGEGKDRRGDYQGTLADASSRLHPGLGLLGRGGRDRPRRGGRRRPRMHPWPAGTAVLGGERAPGPVRVPCVRKGETLPGSPLPGEGLRGGRKMAWGGTRLGERTLGA